jgi:hypothetical protein
MWAEGRGGREDGIGGSGGKSSGSQCSVVMGMEILSGSGGGGGGDG